MVIWLRRDHGDVGIDTDVIRREDLAMLTDLDQGFVEMQHRAGALINGAQSKIDDMIAEAEERATAIAAEAQKKFDSSARLGYAAGYQKGINEIHSQMLARRLDDQSTLVRMQDRIAGIIVKAVEQMIDTADRSSLFNRAAKTVGRELADATFVTVSVHPVDLSKARAAFLKMGDEMRWPIHAEFIENRNANPGDCLCEWDYGVLDAGLAKQLQAMRRSVKKVVDGGASLSASSDHAAGTETQDRYAPDSHENYGGLDGDQLSHHVIASSH